MNENFMKPNLLILCFSDLKRPRPRKQISTLSQYFKEITAVGYDSLRLKKWTL